MKRACFQVISIFIALLLLSGCSGTPQANQPESDLVCSVTTQILNNQICYQSSLANNSTQGFTINTVAVTVCVLGICGPSQTISDAEAYCPPGQSESNEGCIDLPAIPGVLSGSLKFVFSGVYDDGTPEEKTCTVNW